MRNKLATVLFGAGLSLQAWASDIAEVEPWLEKMHQAAHMLNYEGTFVYGQQDQLSSIRIIHSVSEAGERERLISMDGTGREVLRDGDRVICIYPDSQSVMVEKSRPRAKYPPIFPVKVGELNDHYRLSLAGKDKVAGEPTQKILIEPRDNLRYGHLLWVHEKTGLLLKTNLLNENNKPVEQFMFTQIIFLDDVPEDALEPDINKEDFTWYEASGNTQSDEAEQASAWHIATLPPGFKQDMSRMHRIPNSVMPVEHRVYSDGLASVSVFIEKDDNKSGDNLFGGSHMGAVNAHGRNLNGYHVTVVGEVPQATVKMIGESVHYRESP
ncbi:MucB/RseB C-terminal domain-containing protein [Thiohalophilus sp.]|uniref:MucB/RseB C-terminal domain-containing protein n=1 Tax=Thiohalophilus sp. TaxID=3028392 RepID=UPI002ACDC4DF|nr:MucB/RseB C-terminal domain-containing protein [Thiohalophilus sp.]MDZ7805081.1 MucB/RseB C-terminal domain-containing protein [Thiohalophilus sp.]